ncbi:MAG: tyrosine-type recombinase/integrase [Planctomycetaceae bacterium]
MTDTPSIKLMKTLRASRQMPSGVIGLELWAVWFGLQKDVFWELVKSRRVPHHMVGQRVLIDSRNLAPTVTPEGGPEPAENPVEGLDLYGLLERYSFSRTNINQRSIDQMFYSVNLLNRFQGGIVLADELSELLLGRFVKWLQMEAYLPSTVKRNLNNISTLWKWGYKRRLCRERFEQLDPIRIPKAIPTAWTLQELARILGACRQLKGRMRDGCKRSDWWESLILVLYDTGARIRAAMCLRRSDINLDQGYAVLGEMYAKTGVAQLVDLSPDTVEVLRRLLASHSDVLVWPSIQKSSRNLHTKFHDILRSVGLDENRVGFHRLRKTHATAVVSQLGWEAARVALGHSTEQMTRRYVDPRQLPRVRLSLPRPILDEDVGNSSD